MTLQLVPVLVLLGTAGSFGLWTVDKLIVRSSGSITVPCHYRQMFREHVKYWCRGKLWHTCVPVKESAGRISITDNREELVVTLTLSNLQSRDAGRYWCAIKIRGFMKADVRTSLELLVTKGELDLWVRNSTVSVPEGGNVSIECFYSDKLKDTEKKWCRSGDLLSCQSEHGSQLSQHAQLYLSDYGSGSFTATLMGLQREDGGWYWCMAAGIQVPVYITITAAPSTPNCTDRTRTSNKPRTSSPVTAGPLEGTLTTWSTLPLAVLTIHPSVAPSAAISLHTWLMVLLTGGMLLTAATVAALVWRWQVLPSRVQMREDATESAVYTVRDDVDLMAYERTSSDVDEESSTTVLL